MNAERLKDADIEVLWNINIIFIFPTSILVIDSCIFVLDV
jgi:hypothetical protein